MIRNGLADHWPCIERSTTTGAQYDDALALFRRRPDPPGRVLEWVWRGDSSYLDLTNDRMELLPTLSPEVGNGLEVGRQAPAQPN